MSFFDFKSKFFKRPKKIEETENMKIKRELMEENINITKDLEIKLEDQRVKEKLSRITYQHECNHPSLILGKTTPQNANNNTSFTDYTAKCEVCNAQLYNKQRIMAYIYSTIGLLGKMPKIVESLKIVELDNEEDFKTIEKAIEIIEDLNKIKNRISGISENDFTNNIIYRTKEIDKNNT